MRGTQAASALAERRGWSSLAKVPTDSALLEALDLAGPSRPTAVEGLLAYFRTRDHRSAFGGLADREATVASLRRYWPEEESALTGRADRFLHGRFDVLGFRDLSFGDPIDWQREPVTGRRAPAHHWSQLNYLDPTVTGDKKIVWELNRHQHFVTLGQAYWLTDDARYAQGFVAQLTSWMDQNPPKLGINWASSLEVALRSIAWLWAMAFFKDATALTPAVFARALKFLYLSARHIESYLSTYFSPNTHLTGEALALAYVGTMIPEFRAATRWRALGERILLEQLDRQFYRDGVYFERSPYYQRYTTDFYIHWLLLGGATSESLFAQTSNAVADKLKLSLDHLMHLTRPDGTTPFIGDDDGGRLLMLDDRPANDFRGTLSTGAALFQRGDYKFAAAGLAQETLWLLGPSGLAAFGRLPAVKPDTESQAFPEGGFYVMRDGWSAGANYLVVDGGQYRTDGRAHAHASALAFDLAARGRTILVDPGTYTYTGSPEWRDWFRSSPAHNALTIDGKSSSIPAGPFAWSKSAVCKTRSWLSCSRFDYFEGEHDGYDGFAAPLLHTRCIFFLKGSYWVIADRVVASGKHRYESWFHFDVGTTPVHDVANGSDSVSETDGLAGLTISGFAREATWRREEAAVSCCYGKKLPAPAYVLCAETTGGFDAVTFLSPQGASALQLRPREIEAIGGRAFEVGGDNSHDIVVIRSSSGAGRCETRRFVSDCEWTWMRFADERATLPDEIVLIGGHSLELDGTQMIRSGRRIRRFVAQRVRESFRIETEHGVRDATLPIDDLDVLFDEAATDC